MPPSGPRSTYRYSEEFKATAVRLGQIPGVEVQDVAASLYIHPFMLSRWRKQARAGRIGTNSGKGDRDMARGLWELRRPPRSTAFSESYAALEIEPYFKTDARENSAAISCQSEDVSWNFPP